MLLDRFQLISHARIDELVFHFQHQPADDALVNALIDDRVLFQRRADALFDSAELLIGQGLRGGDFDFDVAQQLVELVFVRHRDLLKNAQAAVLAQLTNEVYAVERLGPLLEKAKAHMRTLQQFNVRLKHADGQFGLPEAAPFDSIIVAAAGSKVPQALLEQLALGGRLVLPVGTTEQYLSFIERTPQGYAETRLDAVRFVPLLAGTQ